MSDTPSYRVVEAIAREEGVSATELSPPLFSVIDPDALDAVVQGGSNTDHLEITFTYLGYVVRVRSGPTVSVSVQADEAAAVADPVTEERTDAKQ